MLALEMVVTVFNPLNTTRHCQPVTPEKRPASKMADLASLENSTAALILHSRSKTLSSSQPAAKAKPESTSPPMLIWSAIVANRTMAKSVGTAVVADGARLVECETQERLKTRGHEKARQIAGMDASAKEHPAENDNLDDIVHKLQHAHVTGVYMSEYRGSLPNNTN
ncbi:uncharacterized protein ACHE_30593S [Aspergillus chevalieri]|uniref:Uncharacterized protein n=1 Tax=Aspergillus chevalieri TaxID=182096 RepID=A0A7R7VL55_ASPCH|nr:uncharacterized protein ACHE_30593S [Aspergillus chevalieri]BCR86606.1 hypothetical protein ACHE_30593S [Aspergillus chevalieri]